MAEKAAGKRLSDSERLILQNIFDTQPKKRAAYLSQLGFEMNPKDDGQYRPKGSGAPWGEIDPGISAYFKKGGLKEVALDLGDNLADIGKTALMTIGGTMGGSSGAGTGAALGAAAGPALPAGAAVGAAALAIPGFMLGAGLGAYASEELKNAASDMILENKDIPADRMTMGIQSMLQGAFAGLLQGGKFASKEASKAFIQSQKDSILRALGNGASEDSLRLIAAKPELYTKEGSENAVKDLTKIYRNIFGLEDATQIKRPEQIREGLFRQKIQPLNDQAKEQLSQLNVNPEADFSAGEVRGTIQKMIDHIRGARDNFELGEEQKQAIHYLQGKLDEFDSSILKKTPGKKAIIDGEEVTLAPTQSANPDSIKVPFGKAYNLAKAIQEDAYDREVPGSNFLRSFVGGDGNGLTAALDQRAGKVGSLLPQINDQRSQIMQAYKTAAATLTPTNIQNAFLSTNKDNVAKQMVREAAESMDHVLGTDLSKQIESGSTQAWVQDLYARPGKDVGSKNLLTAKVKGAATGAVKGGIGGAGLTTLTGMGPLPGAVGGAVAGAVQGAKKAIENAEPQVAIENWLKLHGKQMAPTPSALDQFTSAQPATMGLANAVTEHPLERTLNAPSATQGAPGGAENDPFSFLDGPTPGPAPAPAGQPPAAPAPQAAKETDPFSFLDTP